MPANASWGWLLHFVDHDPVEVYCHPVATHAEMLERYSEALAAEPLPERMKRAPTEAEASALGAMVQTVGEAEQWNADVFEWAMATALADPEGALACYRALVSELRTGRDSTS